MTATLVPVVGGEPKPPLKESSICRGVVWTTFEQSQELRKICLHCSRSPGFLRINHTEGSLEIKGRNTLQFLFIDDEPIRFSDKYKENDWNFWGRAKDGTKISLKHDNFDGLELEFRVKCDEDSGDSGDSDSDVSIVTQPPEAIEESVLQDQVTTELTALSRKQQRSGDQEGDEDEKLAPNDAAAEEEAALEVISIHSSQPASQEKEDFSSQQSSTGNQPGEVMNDNEVISIHSTSQPSQEMDIELSSHAGSRSPKDPSTNQQKRSLNDQSNTTEVIFSARSAPPNIRPTSGSDGNRAVVSLSENSKAIAADALLKTDDGRTIPALSVFQFTDKSNMKRKRSSATTKKQRIAVLIVQEWGRGLTRSQAELLGGVVKKKGGSIVVTLQQRPTHFLIDPGACAEKVTKQLGFRGLRKLAEYVYGNGVHFVVPEWVTKSGSTLRSIPLINETWKGLAVLYLLVSCSSLVGH